MDYSFINDYELLYLIKGSNPEYINILINKYSSLINSISLYFFNNYNIPYDDIYVECLNTFCKCIYTYRENGSASFSTYVNSALIKASKNFLKRYYALKNYPLNCYISLDRKIGNYTLGETITNYEDSYSNLISNYSISKINDFKYNLPLDSSSIFDLLVSGFKPKEISRLLDISINKVNYEIKTIRKKLINYFKFIDI